MKLPIKLDMEPMLSAPSANGIPEGDSWEYEPKWDGFRTLVFRDGDQVELVSRGARPMTRYFPEVLPAFRTLREKRLVLDGELVVVAKHGLDFGALQQRIHPAESRVRMLSEATPAWYIAFDILAAGDVDLRSEPLGERRKRLWVKVKHQRTADCVVIGWRRSNDGKTLGALLLGLYDKKGTLHYIGHTSSFNAAEKRELIARLKPLETAIPAEEWNANPGRMPGGLSRWSRGKDKDTEWVGVRPELVCEVTYDKLEAGERFRHATGFLRWRPDKPPRKCGFDQIASAAEFDVRGIFRSK